MRLPGGGGAAGAGAALAGALATKGCAAALIRSSSSSSDADAAGAGAAGGAAGGDAADAIGGDATNTAGSAGAPAAPLGACLSSSGNAHADSLSHLLAAGECAAAAKGVGDARRLFCCAAAMAFCKAEEPLLLAAMLRLACAVRRWLRGRLLSESTLIGNVLL